MFAAYASKLIDLTSLHLGWELSGQQVQRLCDYGDLLLEWNQRLNLTRITEPEEIILKHFIDSMKLMNFIEGSNLADLGTGAGFPGLPLKILNPDLDIALIDSLKKRLDFLDLVISKLHLKGIRTVHARAEDLGRDPRQREMFATVTSRAVARLPVLLEYALPLVKVNGLFLSPKGLQAEEELSESATALKLLGGTLERVENYSLGESAEHRAVIIVRKTKKTPPAYPRKAGTPVKSPLIDVKNSFN